MSLKQHSKEADELDFLCRKMSDVRVRQSGGGVATDTNGDDDARLQLSDLSIEQLEKIKTSLQHSSEDKRKQELIYLRKLLAHDDIQPFLDKIIAVNIIPLVSDLLSCDSDPETQFEAAWILTNVAAGNNGQTRAVVNCGTIPKLVNLVQMSPHKGIREQSVWCLGNIAGDSIEMRSAVLDAGALQPLVDLIVEEMNSFLAAAPSTAPDSLSSVTKSAAFEIDQPLSNPTSPRKDRQYTLNTLRICIWVLSNFCRGNGTATMDWTLINYALPVLSQVLMCCSPDTVNCDDEVLMDACWALSRTLRGIHEDYEQVIVDVNLCRKIGQLCTYSNSQVQVPALRCLINIVSGSDVQTQQVIDAGVLPRLLHLLQYPKNDTVMKETCLIISNITAGTESQVNAVMSEQNGLIISKLIDIVSNADYRIKREACWALCNACLNQEYSQISFLVQEGMLPPLAQMISHSITGGNDDRIVLKVLEAIKNILVCGDAYVAAHSGSQVDQQAFAQILDGMKIAEDKNDSPDSAYTSNSSLGGGIALTHGVTSLGLQNPFALVMQQKVSIPNDPLIQSSSSLPAHSIVDLIWRLYEDVAHGKRDKQKQISHEIASISNFINSKWFSI
ncbi:hypothetical protein MIR68_004887 [Amoeboaphelidium protococcarum]|nr:hypothetical protein MIR68_004887 [Amoeboaphelidium protococcarum]